MLKEFVQSITGLATDAEKPKELKVNNRTYLVGKDGVIGDPIETHIEYEKSFKVLVGTVPDFVRTIGEMRSVTASIRGRYGLESKPLDEIGSMAGVCSNRVDCVIDIDSRQDQVVLELLKTKQFETLQELKHRAFTQKALIKFLRVDLDGTGADRYVQAFRNLVWNRSGKSAGVVNHADESMGRSIEDKVATNGEALPEELNLNVAVYVNPDIVVIARIKVVVIINFEDQQIELAVPPSEIDNAKKEARGYVRDLVETEVNAQGLGDKVNVIQR